MPPYPVPFGWEYQSVEGYWTGTADRTVTTPAHVDGDLLLLMAWQGVPDENDIDLPAGWTEDGRFNVNSEMSAVCAHRVAASEPGSYTIGFVTVGGAAPGVGNAAMISSWRDHGGIGDFAATAGDGTHPPDYSTDARGENAAATGVVDATEHGTLVVFSAAIGIASTSAGIPVSFAQTGGYGPSGGAAYQFPSGRVGSLDDTAAASLGPYAFSNFATNLRGWATGLWALHPLALGGWGVGMVRMDGAT